MNKRKEFESISKPTYATVDIKDGREDLINALEQGPVTITLTGTIDGPVSRDDGISVEFGITPEAVEISSTQSEVGDLSFSEALKAIKQGKKVTRAGWSGKDMFLFLVPGSTFKVNRPPLLGIYPEGTEIQYHGHIDMKTAQGYVVPWLASQADLLTDDWVILKD